MMPRPSRTQPLGALAAMLAVSGCGGSSPTKTVTAAPKTVTITANPATQTNPGTGS
jgi:predicted component of type VI protein secretion system